MLIVLFLSTALLSARRLSSHLPHPRRRILFVHFHSSQPSLLLYLIRDVESSSSISTAVSQVCCSSSSETSNPLRPFPQQSAKSAALPHPRRRILFVHFHSSQPSLLLFLIRDVESSSSTPSDSIPLLSARRLSRLELVHSWSSDVTNLVGSSCPSLSESTAAARGRHLPAPACQDSPIPVFSKSNWSPPKLTAWFPQHPLSTEQSAHRSSF